MTPDKINSYFYSTTIFIHIKRDEPRLQTVFCQFRSGFVTPKCFQSILDLGVEKQAVVGLSWRIPLGSAAMGLIPVTLESPTL